MNKRQIDSFYALTLAVRRLFHKLGHGVGELHAGAPVTVGMRAVLESVVNGGPQTVPQMARVRPVSRQHIQGLVNNLLEAGYVEYVDNPAHQRSKLVRATPSGRAVFREMRERENEVFRRLAIDVAPEQFEAATKVLRTLIDTFDGPDWREILAHTATEGGQANDDQ